MTQAILFDMDGTLFQTDLILEPALEATFEVLRKERQWQGETPIEKYREIMGVPLSVVWETLCPNHSLELRNKSNDIFQQQLITLISKHRGALYDGVEETLAFLSERYPLFIASNGYIEYLAAIVEAYQLQRFIQQTYSIQSIASGNKSELVELVKTEHQIQGGFVVGDRASDIQAAKDNHFTSIGVRFDFAQDSELQYADHVVDSFKDIVKVI
ncbi:HAD hydrolase-like protein [Sporosarcina sp. FSL K6-1522]|uniref:HAD hydrolase-like protein n=1 Tax=Sporosarcina sp. FSL K6-1522 TaxID=2921554 RepID=UPI00315AE456